MTINQPIQIKYKTTSNLYKASTWLNNLPELFAADFETASKWNKKDKQLIKYKLDFFPLEPEERRILMQEYTSDGLSHPSLCYTTHLNVAWSNHNAFVIICKNDEMRKLIYNFLVTTDKMQIWHNCQYDFKYIYYHTKKIPKNFIDTQLLAKSILNDANGFRNKTGLKDLMGYAYGAWAIAKDNFEIEKQEDPEVLKYCATDACATYHLYEDIMEDLNEASS